MDPNLMNLFSDDIIRDIVVDLAKRRRASIRDISESVSATNGDLSENLDRLCDAHLVDVVPAGDPEFDTYYLTAEGLKTYRTLANTFAMHA
jgi:DNA-binding MarR family transcriptional regulator